MSLETTFRYLPVILTQDLSGLSTSQIIGLRRAKGREITRFLYAISRPLVVQSPSEANHHLFATEYDYDGVMTEAFIEVHTQYDSYVNPLVDPEYVIRGIYEQYKEIGLATEDEILSMMNYLDSLRRGRIYPYSLFTPAWKAMEKTRHEMRLDGWFKEYNDETGEVIPYP